MNSSPCDPICVWLHTAVTTLIVTTISVTALLSSGCRSAPISGRRQVVAIPEAQEISMGLTAYEETLAEEPMSEDQEVIAMVNRVGKRIAAVADKPEYDWEFRVIAKDVMNAFALPGGKVAVYEGILPVCQDEAGLAVVMSHEVAHALARHGGERMTHQMGVNGVGGIIKAVSQKKASEPTTDKIMQAYGVVSEYGVILPYSRKHESEADAIGLILMAKAGYDPSVAPEFWERFSTQNGEKPPEWLSTHPADARRAADLRALLPEAMKYYEAASEKIGMGEIIPINRRAPRTLVTSTPDSAPLQQLAFAPGSPQKAAMGPPPPLPEKIDPFLDHDTVATNAPPSPELGFFQPPVMSDPMSAKTIEAYRLESLSSELIDDGWEPAVGRAQVQ
ncbi:MAG: M48 family metallopeptidase [Planctomycetaceae bacterium]|nr:M48 family metallopeptidase [Planctomycetaceae bacterium]